MNLVPALEQTPSILGILPLYGIIVFLGGLVTTGFIYIEWNKKGYRNWDFLFFFSWVLLFAIYGAKLWYIIFDPLNAFGNVNDILDVLIIIFIPAFGRTIIGTIVFVPVGIWIWQIKWGGEYKTLELMDIVLPAFFIGQAIGRWGNFVNHEVYGSIVSEESLNWLPDFIKNEMFINGSYRQPLFLYESLLDLVGFVTLLLVFKTNNYFKDGVAGFTYIATYGLFRSCTELLRDSDFIMSWGSIPTSFVVALIMFVTGTVISLYLQFNKNEKNN